MKKIYSLLFLCSVAIIINGCSTNEISVEQESKIKTTSIEEARIFVNANILTNGFASKKQNSKADLNNITQEKINNSDQLLTVVPFITNDADVNSRLLLLNVKGETKAVIIKMYPDKNVSTQYFSGKLMIYTVGNEFVNGFRFKNSIAVSQFIKAQSNITSRDSDGGELNEVIIYNGYSGPRSTSLDFAFFSWDSGGGSGGGDVDLSFTWDSGGGSSESSSDCQEGYIEDPYGNCVLDEQIIDELTGKEKCLNALLSKDGNTFVQKLLANFAGISEFNIKIVSKDKVTVLDENGNIKEVNGITRHTQGSTLMTIDISSSRADEHSALDVARTILHEYIHADMYRKLNTKDDTNTEVKDFKKTYYTYETEQQHAAMGALYINMMKDALKEFHKNVLTDDYNKYISFFGELPSDDFYEALAWGGLRENNIKSWSDLPTDKKTAIEKLANRAILLSKTAPCTN